MFAVRSLIEATSSAIPEGSWKPCGPRHGRSQPLLPAAPNVLLTVYCTIRCCQHGNRKRHVVRTGAPYRLDPKRALEPLPLLTKLRVNQVKVPQNYPPPTLV